MAHSNVCVTVKHEGTGCPSQQADQRGHKLPTDALSGQAMWKVKNSGVGTGRLLESDPNVGLARSFSSLYACTRLCPTGTLSPDASSLINVGDNGDLGGIVVHDCGIPCNFRGYGCGLNYEDTGYQDFPNVFTWVLPSFLSLTSVDSGNGTARFVGISPGSDFGSWHAKISDDPYLCTVAGTGPAAVKPKITGPNTVWWFNGSNPSGYATQITLTSSGGNGVIWAVTAGSEKVSVNPTGNTLTVQSSGSSFSSFVGDIKITAQVNYETSSPFSLTTRTPRDLVPDIYSSVCDPTWGYQSDIKYLIRDQMMAYLPLSVPLNENWTTTVMSDYAGTNWRRQDPGAANTDPSTPAMLEDIIQGENIALPPIPPTACPGAGLAVEHWGQEWRIGDLSIGSGKRVQTDVIQKYENYAEHESIVSPAP